jgi:hypothetical protein
VGVVVLYGNARSPFEHCAFAGECFGKLRGGVVGMQIVSNHSGRSRIQPEEVPHDAFTGCSRLEAVQITDVLAYEHPITNRESNRVFLMPTEREYDAIRVGHRDG